MGKKKRSKAKRAGKPPAAQKLPKPTMGDVRSALIGDKASWEKLFKVVKRWEDLRELDEVVIPYCMDHYAHDDSDRRLPLPDAMAILAPKETTKPGILRLAQAASRLASIVSLHAPRPSHKHSALRPLTAPVMWRAIHVVGYRTTDEFVSWLTELDAPHLRFLNISPELNEEQRERIAEAFFDRSLEHFGVGHAETARLVPEFLRRQDLTSSPFNSLSLSDATEMPPELVREIFSFPVTAKIRHLDMSSCYLSPESMDELLAAPHLELIETLDIRYNWNISEDQFYDLERKAWCMDDISLHYDSVWE